MEKKIGIITIVDNNNYGNRLQNYAVTKVYEKLGFSVETLVLNQRKGNVKYFPRAIKMILEPVKRKYNFRKNNVLVLKRMHKFEKFNRSNGIIIKFYPFWSAVAIRRKYDFFSVGSDQIWNYNLNCGYGTEFLDFAKQNQRITFSPSFGVDSIPEEKRDVYETGLKGFKYLSVREKAGVDLIYRLTGQRAEVIVDPTMMLDKNDWLKIAKKPDCIDADLPYILEYFLGGKNEEMEFEISKFAQENNLRRVQLLNKDLADLFCVDPSEFIYMINHAEVVATDSFHATVFSIIFSKKIAIYERIGHKEMGSRITTLLEMFGVSEKFFDGINNIKEITGVEVESVLMQARKRGYDFLYKEMGITEK